MTDDEVLYHLKLHALRARNMEAVERKIGSLELQVMAIKKRLERLDSLPNGSGRKRRDN